MISIVWYNENMEEKKKNDPEAQNEQKWDLLQMLIFYDEILMLVM